jgi:hypothetical protein
MKACVHCAEQIQDDASVCRHCGRPVPQQAEKISHRGSRYGVGTTSDSYAVWDLAAGGQPQARFEKSEEGWTQAWAFFQSSESAGGVPVAVQGGQTSSTNGLAVASLVLGIVWLYGIGSILALIFGFNRQVSDRSIPRFRARGGHGRSRHCSRLRRVGDPNHYHDWVCDRYHVFLLTWVKL